MVASLALRGLSSHRGLLRRTPVQLSQSAAAASRLLSSSTNSSTNTSVLANNVDAHSEEFQANKAHMSGLVSDLDRLQGRISRGGPGKARLRHTGRGKMLARDRIGALLDPGSPFVEVGNLAGWNLYESEGEDAVPCAGIITGIGLVQGNQTMIVANDPTVKAGAYYPITVKKHLRAQKIARENRLPCVYMTESAGAALPYQADVFPDELHFGRIFAEMSQMSALGIPQISIVHGISVAGGAYVPAMADETIIVRKQGTIFLAGPPLVKAALGEVVDDETLGGGEMHSSISGVTDHLAIDDAHAVALARSAMANLGSASALSGAVSSGTFCSGEEPLYNASELDGIVPPSLRQPFEMRDIIARLVDGSRLHEFKPRYGTTLVCGFSHLGGQACGILANNGILFGEAAKKAASFVALCNQRAIPLVFLVNVTGYMVGARAEREGIAKDGAKMVRAVACADVPKLTVIIGGSYGAGNYGMNGRAYSPRFLWTWPTARVAVMGGEQLSSVMSGVSSSSNSNKDTSKSNHVSDLAKKIDDQSLPLYGSARLWDDGIIRPRDTRATLALALDVASQGRQRSWEWQRRRSGHSAWDGNGYGSGVFR